MGNVSSINANPLQIYDLADENILKIFSYLNERELLVIQAVSKRFNEIANDNLLWITFAKHRKININFTNRLPLKEMVTDYAKQYIHTLGPVVLTLRIHDSMKETRKIFEEDSTSTNQQEYKRVQNALKHVKKMFYYEKMSFVKKCFQENVLITEYQIKTELEKYKEENVLQVDVREQYEILNQALEKTNLHSKRICRMLVESGAHPYYLKYSSSTSEISSKVYRYFTKLNLDYAVVDAKKYLLGPDYTGFRYNYEKPGERYKYAEECIKLFEETIKTFDFESSTFILNRGSGPFNTDEEIEKSRNVFDKVVPMIGTQCALHDWTYTIADQL